MRSGQLFPAKKPDDRVHKKRNRKKQNKGKNKLTDTRGSTCDNRSLFFCFQVICIVSFSAANFTSNYF